MTTARYDDQARTSGIGQLTIAALLGIAGAAMLMLARMYSLAGEAPPPVIGFVVVPALAALGMAYRRRWAAVTGAVTSTLIALMLVPHLPRTLAEPADALFMPFVLLTGFALSASVLGTIAAVQAVRAPAGRRVPRWVPVKLGAVGGVVAGILAMASVARPGASAGIDPALLARLPALETEAFAFVQQEIRVRAGETVALRLENRDPIAHSFDLDEFDVHVLMPASGTAVALFVADEPGTYTFYCAPHYDHRTGKGMRGTLVVEAAAEVAR